MMYITWKPVPFATSYDVRITDGTTTLDLSTRDNAISMRTLFRDIVPTSVRIRARSGGRTGVWSNPFPIQRPVPLKKITDIVVRNG